MDVGVDPQRRLALVGAGREAGDRDQPDVAALETPADALQSPQRRITRGVIVQQPGQFVVAVIGIKTGSFHGKLLAAAPRARDLRRGRFSKTKTGIYY